MKRLKHYKEEQFKIVTLEIDSILRWDRQNLNKFQVILWKVIRKLVNSGLRSLDKSF